MAEAALRALVGGARFEIIPMKSAGEAIAALPAGVSASVTCSPTKGVDATLDVAADLVARGHHTVPHLSARMVEGPAQVAAIAERLARLGIDEVFVIAGDATEARGPYAGAFEFAGDLLAAAPFLRHVGFAAYPDGHPLLDEAALRAEVRRKAELCAGAGVDMHLTTQMCFNPERVRQWLRSLRAEGVSTPVHLGAAGVVERVKLASLGMRLGVGSSLRYLRKNAGALKVLGRASYDPAQIIAPLAAESTALGIAAVHLFTFNQVASTVQWREALLA